MKRSPLRRKPSTLAKSRLKPVSARRKVELRRYSELRKEYLEAHPMCMLTTKGIRCPMQTTDIHHLAGRNGKRLTDFSKVIGLCRQHHAFCHSNPAWARQNGYLI